MINGHKRLQELSIELAQARYAVAVIEGKILLLQEFLISESKATEVSETESLPVAATCEARIE